jgi:hypothetical protein
MNKNKPIIPADGKKIDHTADVLVMTTIPYRARGAPRDPDGYSEWIVHGPTKAKVINSPGYPQPLPKPKASDGIQPAYVIKPTPNMGLGVFATRDIKMDELIFAERPLLVSPRSNTGFSIENLQQYDLKTQMAIAMMEWEKTLEAAVGRMESAARKAFMELANSHKHDGSGPILGIIRTNGFRVGGNIFDGPVKREDGYNAYSGVIKIGSRINHRYVLVFFFLFFFETIFLLNMLFFSPISCMPNVKIEFATPSFSFQCSALVDIKAGEQLFYSYCRVDQPAAERQVGLAPYSLVCSCLACKHATPETDKLRTEYRKIAMDYIINQNYPWNRVSVSARRGAVAEKAVEPVVKFKDALIKEGFHYTSEYKGMICVLQNFYEDIGMREKARGYKEEYKRYKLSSEKAEKFASMVFTK